MVDTETETVDAQTISGAAGIVQELCSRDSNFASCREQYRSALAFWEQSGLLTPADLAGKHVLDWECGRGVFAALFLEMGAAHVTGIDSWLDVPYARSTLGGLPNAVFERIALDEFALRKEQRGAFDVVLANTVTEHMLRLPNLLTYCWRLLRPGGLLLINHDNYYHPVGSHDHGFLRQVGSEIVAQGPRCWEAKDKCAASREFRAEIARRYPWTWDERTQSQLTPDDCTQCPRFRRAQPWAHLLYQDDFRRVFAQPCFTTGYRHSSLNKVTPFQLRQFLIEAGFEIVAWYPHRISNVPPAELLRPPFGFSQDDLCTAYITARCQRDDGLQYFRGTLPKI
jgi:2-polyprenyl-6-hydroxyphenyl methylase/3-demethylubiquinone-9 3-methyltransferase